MKKIASIAAVIILLFLTGCSQNGQIRNDNDMDYSGEQASGIEDQMTEENDSHMIMDPIAIPGLRVGDTYYTIDLENNSSAESFFEKIKEEPLTVEMHDYGNFEKVGDLPWELPANDEETTTKPGDIILYQGNKITIYYDENT